MKDLRGQVAVVTGAGSGIGQALAERFAAEGMKVVIADIDADALDRVRSSLELQGAEVLSVSTDVSRAADVEALAAKTLARFEAVHVLCNNAGVVGPVKPSWEYTAEDWDWVLGVNLQGVIHGIRVFVPILLEQRSDAHIINTASIAGLRGGLFKVGYDATKHGVVAISEALYHELSLIHAKINVSVLCPGPVRTSVMESERNRPDILKDEVSVEKSAWQRAAQAADDMLREAISTHGSPPAEIADQVVRAIWEHQFYVLPIPNLEMYKAFIRERTEHVVEQRNPPVLTGGSRQRKTPGSAPTGSPGIQRTANAKLWQSATTMPRQIARRVLPPKLRSFIRNSRPTAQDAIAIPEPAALAPAQPLGTHPWVLDRVGKISFGIAYGPQWEACFGQAVDHRPWLEFVQTVEALGFDSYWLMDHPALAPDCWTQLAAFAVGTRRIHLGSLVNCVFYRSPALLARVAGDVHAISDGRAILGIGTGDMDFEFTQFGLTMPTGRERRDALDETLQILHGVWGETPFSLNGRRFRVAGLRLRSGSDRQSRIPIMIGGGGERVTLQRVAQFADVSNLGALAWAGGAFEPEDIERKWAALRLHCETIARPYEAILRSHLALPVVVRPTTAEANAAFAALPPSLRLTSAGSSAIIGSTETVIERYRDLRSAGFQYFIASIFGSDIETVRLLAEEVAPAVGILPTEQPFDRPIL
jgi:NAD(P)-dependent dehydrogenase (short-subunit alcohol dehydrogenase family)/alkanesulfonate monooxygenase SsuD/methylene tetrahydromethanopterin reductase-like flavin-dependent oxidoreductase (luciferase family)